MIALRSRRLFLPLALLSLAATSFAGGAGAASAAPRFTYHDSAGSITLTAPAYQVVIAKRHFQISARRAGRTVLNTTNTDAIDFTGPNGQATATDVRKATWSHGVLTLSVATTDKSATLAVKVTPSADRYKVESTVQGATPTATGMHFAMASAGHWYGHGEASTDEGGPYTDQPWPLDSGKVADDAFGPASYQMVDPFWFTQSAAGIFFDTQDLMNVDLGKKTAGVAGMEVTGSPGFAATFFVEKTPKAVYDDYIGITGKPAKSDAEPYQYETPLWNSWAQFYTNVDQAGFLDYVHRLHDAKVPGHTMSLDDGWMSHYGDFTFNSKFPDPKAMSDEVHNLGDKFGLWVTLWINLDADNYKVAADKGYLLKSKDDPSKPCTVDWWNGKAGIVDLGNPDARAWYTGQLQALEKTYGVDGFKFDTRFYDETCAPAQGYTANDYVKLGAQLTDEFDQQGVGVRIHWTGSQKYGFVTREIDKGTDWTSLQAAVHQDLAVSTIGYPFVETDMVGGSEGGPPPSKEVLIRWAQAAAAMPLIYSSTSPIRVYDYVNNKWIDYDPDTVKLYNKALDVHKRLAPYIERQVKATLRSGDPIMQPLFFDFPSDKASYTIGDEWLLGDSLLTAPVLSEGTSRDVHLPPGEWYDVTRGRTVRGDLHAYPSDLGTLPLFVRMGTPDTKSLIAALRH
ncbi:glycoside hydrolase family 31 protein [Actinoallomurus bryophytorum]|uniref:Alpha-glucosidase (Family GH31 glycosyl hydrolase) n=1 Tax=Actinoallomurus bryophytorum TaxID=1490222 RepID=A0A543CSI7_9ACTN|nr:TIM-barrel domain-containing protein [Actinoallomurus bryophytorum]TQM00077.1 alpha-glucosidase (family GH31 glycosyl hydrolase) [Actinoallomurus bryophytorum]